MKNGEPITLLGSQSDQNSHWWREGVKIHRSPPMLVVYKRQTCLDVAITQTQLLCNQHLTRLRAHSRLVINEFLSSENSMERLSEHSGVDSLKMRTPL